MAQNINIPFDLTINSIKNTNEAFSRLSNQIASNVSDGIEKGLGKINLKGFDVTQLSKDIKSTNIGFGELVDTVTRLKKVFGAANPVVSSFTEALPAGAQNASKAMLNLERVARGVLSRLASGNEEQVKQAQATLKAIFSSDIFNSPANKIAKAQFISNLNQGLKDLEDTAKKTNKAITDDEIRNNKLREKAISDAYNKYASEQARNRELDLQSTLAAAKARQEAEIKIAEETKRKQAKNEAEKRKIVDDTADRIIADKQRERKFEADKFVGAIEQRGKAEEAQRRANVAAEKQLEKETAKVVARQERLNDLLAKAKSLGVQVDPKFQRFVSANAGDIASSQIKDKNTRVANQQLIRDARQLKSDLKEVEKNAKAAQGGIEGFGGAAALAFKRYGAFLVGSFGIVRIVSAFQNATQEALKFEAAMTKVEQVTTSTQAQLKDIGDSVRNAGVITGTSITDIADAVQTFAQAGFNSPDQLRKVATDLAKVPLAATFGDLKSTTEGLIAIFGQFNKGLDDTGEILDTVNQFAADFAVESGDIFEAVKRGGAVFAQSNGSLKEFVELFSLLRSSTRETAETLGTFFKSGVTQLLNPRSQKLLSSLGVDVDKGVVDQFRQLSKILFSIDSRFNSKQINNIAQQLTGDRQVSRLIATLRELEKQRQKTLGGGKSDIDKTLESINGSFDKSIVKRIDDVGISFNRLKESVSDFVIEFFQTDSIKSLIKDVANLAIEFTRLSKILVPLAPLFVGIVSASVLPKFTSNFRSGLTQVFGKKDATNKRSLLSKENLIDSLPLIVGGATAISSSLSNIIPEKNITNNLKTTNVGSAITSGVGGAVLGGSLFGVPGAIVGGLTATILSLTSAIKENTQNLISINLDRAKDPLAKLELAGNQLLNPSKSGIQEFFDNTPRLIRKASSVFFDRSPINRPESFSNLLSGNLPNGDKPSSILDIKLIDTFNNTLRLIRNNAIDKAVKNLGPNANAALIQKSAVEDLKKQIGSLSIVKNAKDVEGTINTILAKLNITTSEIKKFIDEIFNSLEDPFKNLILKVNNSFEKITNSISKNLDRLAGFSSDINAQAQVKVPTNSSSFFKSAGLDSFNRFNAELTNTAQNLATFLSKDNIRGIFRQFTLNRTGTNEVVPSNTVIGEKSFAEVVGELFNDNKIRTEFSNQFQDVFETLKIVSGKSFTDLFTDLFKSNDITSFLKDNQSELIAIQEKARQAVLNSIEVENQKLKLENDLASAARQSNQALFDLNARIKSLQNSGALRNAQNTQFFANVGVLRSGVANARTLTQAAQTTSFDSNNSFINDLQNSAKVRNREVKFNRLGQGSDISFEAKKGFAESANQANIEFVNKQQEANQRLAEFDTRIASAAQATDILKEAFTTLRNDLRSAGQTISGLADKDIKNIFKSINKFAALDGLQNPTGALNKLNRKEFDQVQQGLNLIGNVELGNGITGSALLGNIQEKIGIETVARLKSAFTGKDERGNVAQQLADLKQQAQDSANLEKQLRNDQINLLKAQASLIPLEQEFYQEQIPLLRSIDTQLEPLTDIRKILDQLFTDKPQKVFMDQSFDGGNESLNKLSMISDNSSTLVDIGNNIVSKLESLAEKSNSLEIAPVQVNVALAAPDVLAMVGPTLQASILKNISAKLAEVFRSDPEVSSKILASIGTTT